MVSQKRIRAHKSVCIDQHRIWRVLQAHLRRRRFIFFKTLIAPLARPLCILDVGGTSAFWEDMHFQDEGVKVIVYNLTKVEVSYPGIISMAGDACRMSDFYDRQFDVVFSNSVIEHVGTYQQQRTMAREVQRVGKRYCVQTPNRYFPIEPHVLLPFFQFLPSQLQIFILSHFRSPWGWRLKDKTEATQYIQAIRLLNAKELHVLFPKAQIYREKFLGLTKSFFIYDGWY